MPPFDFEHNIEHAGQKLVTFAFGAKKKGLRHGENRGGANPFVCSCAGQGKRRERLPAGYWCHFCTTSRKMSDSVMMPTTRLSPFTTGRPLILWSSITFAASAMVASW